MSSMQTLFNLCSGSGHATADGRSRHSFTITIYRLIRIDSGDAEYGAANVEIR